MRRGKMALALSAGGARGAYEVGALLFLAEHGVRFDAVSGASIGALNGAFWMPGLIMMQSERPDVTSSLRFWKRRSPLWTSSRTRGGRRRTSGQRIVRRPSCEALSSHQRQRHLLFRHGRSTRPSIPTPG